MGPFGNLSPATISFDLVVGRVVGGWAGGGGGGGRAVRRKGLDGWVGWRAGCVGVGCGGGDGPIHIAQRKAIVCLGDVLFTGVALRMYLG